MMHRIRLVALGAALALGIGASQAQAQSPDSSRRSHARHESRNGGRQERAAARLGHATFKGITLSDAQQEQIRGINAKYKDQRKAFRADARSDGQRPDSAEMAKVRTLNSQHQAELRAVLTADQQSVFDRNIAEMKDKAKNRKGRRGR